jgi:hypothetical protein
MGRAFYLQFKTGSNFLLVTKPVESNKLSKTIALVDKTIDFPIVLDTHAYSVEARNKGKYRSLYYLIATAVFQ